MKKLILAMFCGLCLSVAHAGAQMSKSELVQVNKLRKELVAEKCVVNTKAAKAYSTKSSQYGTITVVTLPAEGCGGGNNWAVFYQVSYNDGQNVLPSSAMPAIDEVMLRDNMIVFRSTEYADDDARCCPSLKKQSVFKLNGNKLVPVK